MIREGRRLVTFAVGLFGLAAAAHAADDLGSGQPLLFTPVAAVLQSPRCLNCHPRGGDSPHQGNEPHLHRPSVYRGVDGRGAPVMRCGACHGVQNNIASGAPGAPNWHLAPSSMGWEGLSTAELCAVLKDRSKNGNRSLPDLVDHMTADPLVAWAWNPGGQRTPPPVDKPTFNSAVRTWAAAGGPCP